MPRALRQLPIIPAFFLLISLFAPQQVAAQGRYACTWVGLPTGPGTCIDTIDNCSPGYTRPANGCSRYSNTAQCIGGGECVSSSPGGTGGSGGSGGPTVANCPSGGKGIDTALGCIPTENLTEFVKWFLRWAIGIGGGIAFLLILWSGFQIMTSSGNPDKLKAGQEQLTATISGLLFLLFSVFLLRLIGLDILQLPGFGQ